MKASITIPDNLNEISVGQYQRYVAVTEGIEGEFLNQRTIEIFCNVPFERVILMSHNDVKEIAEHLVALINQENVDLMKYMPLGIAFGSLVFFYNLANDLTKGTQHSIREELMKEVLEK